ncbi:MAG: hypothetical protein IPK19_41875 [Chloroflexi bacterium]|nr:hypothetical protein [Chloroflexota bacterium]
MVTAMASPWQAAAGKAADRLKHLVCLDGSLPQDGRSFRELFPRCTLIPGMTPRLAGHEDWVLYPDDRTFGVVDAADWRWMQPRLTPFAHHRGTPIEVTIPATLACTTIGASGLTAWRDQQRRRRMVGAWLALPPLSTGHDAMVTAPSGLADLLLELA